MRSVLVVAFLLAGAIPAVGADCAPPCGPIPVVIEIKAEGPKYVTFGDKSEYVSKGTVSFYVNVDGDGFWFDPEKRPVLSFRVNRQPPWVQTSIDPPSYEVPVDDPQFLQNEGSPDQVQYYWEQPVTFTVKKLRDPTPDELAQGSAFIRRDGSYRIVIAASTTSSVVAPDLLGPTNGLQEGYGVKELRFVPEIAGVQWLPDESGVLQPGGQAVTPKGDAPAVPLLATLLVLAAFVGLRRRR